MKIEIIIALGLSISSCVPVPVTPVPDVLDGTNNVVNDSAIVTSDAQVTILDASKVIVDSASISDVSVVDSVVVVQDSAVDSTTLDEASSICSKACNNLIKLGCSEGKDISCVSVCNHVSQTHLIKFDAKCLSTAKDVKSVKACGGISCNK